MSLPRVLHLTYGLDFGGVESHLQLIGELPSARFEHHFAAIYCGGATASAMRAAGMPVTIVGIEPHTHPLRAVAALRAMLRDLRPTVFHAHGAEANLFGLAAAALARVPVRIGEEIGMPAHGPRARLAYRTAYRAAHRVIGVADAVRDWLVATGEVPAAKALRIYNPARLPAVRAAPRRAGEPLRVAYVGRLDPIKNPVALVRAVADLRDEGVACELVLLGEGAERSKLERLIAERGVGDAVRLLGYVSTPSQVLAQSHLLVQPSLSEGLSLALVEAMGCALPVISSRVGGSPEVIDDGRTGWLLNSAGTADIAAAIRTAERLSGDELAAIGRAARLSVEERFDPARYVATIEALYCSLIDART
jgi:glycosyltransferase involved in cell wall biosynthesis